MTAPLEAPALAALYSTVGVRLRAYTGAADAATAMTQLAVELVPGAEFAGLSRLHKDRLVSLGTTDPVVEQVDSIQYTLMSGPCVDALVEDRPVITADLLTEPRWPDFGPLAVARTGVRSMLSYRLFLEDSDSSVLGALNLYSRPVGAFDAERSGLVLSVLSAYAAVAIWGASAVDQSNELQRALDTNREIGTAQGILMNRYRISREEAFGLLRIASQNSNRKLRDIATDLADTGELPLPPPRRRPTSNRS